MQMHDIPPELRFLGEMSAQERQSAMRAELARQLRSYALREIRRLIGQAIRHPFSSTTPVQRRKADMHEWALRQVERSVAIEASNHLLTVLQEGIAFALYLRAFRQEDFDAGLEYSFTEEEKAGAVTLNRAVEIANVGPISELIPVFGLTNLFDVNTLRKYQSVWLPPAVRNNWRDTVRALSVRSSLIILNATVHGTSFREELVEITKNFPDKSWLIAGVNAGEFVGADTQAAVMMLDGFPEHVSIANVSDGGIQYAEPRVPEWVRALALKSRHGILAEKESASRKG